MSQIFTFAVMDIIEFLKRGNHLYLQSLTIDHVIIGYEQQALKCLLLRVGDKWLLPGGYINIDESVDHAALRILKERTNLEDPHSKFLSVFGNSKRKYSHQWKELLETISVPWNEDYWINTRFVTLSYYALVDIDKVEPKPSAFDEEIGWFSFETLPEMWMDHKEIALEARNRLKDDIRHEHVTYNLLPDEFTMPELHILHQTILGQDIDRSRFQKKMLSSGKFERLPKRQKDSPGRNPYQYRVKNAG